MSASSGTDLRARVAAYLDSSDDSVIEALASGLTATRDTMAFATCKGCGNMTAEYLVPMPDYKTRAQVFAILADQGKGKPAETRKVEATVDLTKSLREMTDDELNALASGALSD